MNKFIYTFIFFSFLSISIFAQTNTKPIRVNNSFISLTLREKDLLPASSWARKCVQGSFNADEILGEVFVNCRLFKQLKSRYQTERRLGTGITVVVCGRSSVGKTKSAAGLIALTQKNFSELPYAYVIAGDNLKRSLCQLLICREEWTDVDIVDTLFAALKPYSEEELQGMEFAMNAQAAAKCVCGIPIPDRFTSYGARRTRQNATASHKTRYVPKSTNCPMPVLVIDDMFDSNNDSLIRLIYQQGICAVFKIVKINLTCDCFKVVRKLWGMIRNKSLPIHNF